MSEYPRGGRSVRCYEDKGLNSGQVCRARPERFSKDPLRAVPLDRSSNPLPRQEGHARRSLSSSVAHSSVRGPHHRSRLHCPVQRLPPVDPRISPQALRRHWTTYRVVRRFLPFARRRARTFRPPGLELRARNPCFLLPLRFFGWYVRFMLPSILVMEHSITPLESNTLSTHPFHVKRIRHHHPRPTPIAFPGSRNCTPHRHFPPIQRKITLNSKKSLRDFWPPC